MSASAKCDGIERAERDASALASVMARHRSGSMDLAKSTGPVGDQPQPLVIPST